MEDAKKVHRKQMIMKLGKQKKEPGLEDKVQDPFKVFGHGIVAYFRMMQLLMISFAIMTVIFAPVMYYYYSAKGFDKSAPWSVKLSAASLGHSES